MSIIIKKAETEAEKENIYRLRYEIYVGEMQRKQTYADHKKKQIKEPFDETAILLYAEIDGETVGTIRVNLRKDGPLECEELYNLEKFEPFFPEKISMTTKLMVKEAHRSGMTTSLLCLETYHVFRKNGITLDFIDTNPHLVRLYQQLGYRFYKENISHPDYGDVIPLVFVTNDIEYLRSVHSPLQRLAKGYENDTKTLEYFNQHFSEYSSIKPLFSISSDDLWATLGENSHKDASQVLSFMRGFSKEEANSLLSQLDLIQYNKGDFVFHKGDDSNGMFCILEGQVEVLVPASDGMVNICILHEGEIFGELGFISRSPRTASIRVRNKTKLLLLTLKEFEKLEKGNSKLAMRLMTNLFCTLIDRFNEKSVELLETRNMLDTIIKGSMTA
jgi:CRP-like cAMP-binding protein